MKKYLKYKDFIPLDFIKDKETKEANVNSKAYILLLLINIILLPLNLGLIFAKEEKINNKNIVEDMYISNSDIYKWMDLYSKDIISLKVENNRGEIIFDINEDISYLESLGFEIKKLTNTEYGKNVQVKYDFR